GRYTPNFVGDVAESPPSNWKVLVSEPTTSVAETSVGSAGLAISETTTSASDSFLQPPASRTANASGPRQQYRFSSPRKVTSVVGPAYLKPGGREPTRAPGWRDVDH